MNIEWIGLIAGVLTTLSFVPQVYRTWKTKSADDLSLGMFLMFTLGVILWLIYGFLIDDLPIILANIVTLSLAGTLLIFKIVFRNH
ncbi:MAG: SemiSWEET transporter [Saprospiraceae bacterium]|jgi:MtN3 and saliva related transmembrane protein|nr:SemiSWEET transporter [Saprospiraceae bacterium]